MSDLLNCPFCGGKAELDTQQHYTYMKHGQPRTGTRVVIYCLECSADMGICHEDDECADSEGVTTLWNARTEQALALRGEPVAEPFGWWIEGDGINPHFTKRKAGMEAMRSGRDDGLKTVITSLYAAPQSDRGEPVARMPNEPTLPMLDAALRWMRSNPASMNAASCEYENMQHIYSAMRSAAPLYAAPISGERETDPVLQGVERQDYTGGPVYRVSHSTGTAAISGERVANEKRKGERRIDYGKAGMLNRDCKDRRAYIAPSGERVREAIEAKRYRYLRDEETGDWIADKLTLRLPEDWDAFIDKRMSDALPLAAQPEGK